jgi:RNA 2',3'-cyclic 3'-phosphodiesterase
MAKERLKSPRLRLFIALDLPDSIRLGIEAWGRRALRDPALRPLAVDSLHLTLTFLGWRAEKDLGRLSEIVAASAVSAPRLELLEPIGIPSARPRLYVLGVRSPQAVALQAGLEERLVARRLYELEKRPFWPHVTIARVRPEARGSRHAMRVSRPPPRLPQSLREPFRGVRLTLYRSELKPQGAHYTPLAQVELLKDGRR